MARNILVPITMMAQSIAGLLNRIFLIFLNVSYQCSVHHKGRYWLSWWDDYQFIYMLEDFNIFDNKVKTKIQSYLGWFWTTNKLFTALTFELTLTDQTNVWWLHTRSLIELKWSRPTLNYSFYQSKKLSSQQPFTAVENSFPSTTHYFFRPKQTFFLTALDLPTILPTIFNPHTPFFSTTHVKLNQNYSGALAI